MSGDFVAVHIRFAIGPGPLICRERVLLCLFVFAKGEPQLGEETISRLTQLGQTVGFVMRRT